MAQTILTQAQKVLLGKISQYPPITRRFYFTGGTALTEFYLQHRLSEDLDFFSEEEFDTTYITIFLKKNAKALGLIEMDLRKKEGNRFMYFLDLKTQKLKVDFCSYPYPRIRADLGKSINNLRVDSVFDIATNKVFTLFQHPRLRDYVDLYFIFQKEKDFTLKELVTYARNKFDMHVDPKELAKNFLDLLSLEEKDFPKMLKPFNREKMNQFFVSLARSLEKEIFKE